MKKIALAVLATFIAPALHAAEIYNKDGNKLDLYGSMRARHYFSTNNTIDGDQSYIRFGFKGQTQINDVLTGYGQWEYNVQANHSEGGSDATTGTKTRLGFAGLKLKDYGSIDYGRNWGIAYDVASITDTAPIFDDLTYSNADYFMNGRATGVLTYRNTNFFGLVNGLKFGLQYQGANDANSANARVDSATGTKLTRVANGDGYGASLSYTFPIDLTVVGAYTNSNRTEAQKALKYGAGDYDAEMWAAGVKYDHAGIYAAAQYAVTHHMTPIGGNGFAPETDNVEAIAAYQFDNGLKPMFGYFQSKAKDVQGVGDEYLVKYYDASVTYFFNKNMNTYVDYKINRIDSDNKLGVASDNQIGVGLQYQF